MSVTVDNLYYYFSHPRDLHSEYAYLINNSFYSAYNLVLTHTPTQFDIHPIHSLNVDPNGSKILVIGTDASYSFYQQLSNGRFVDLLERLNYGLDGESDLEVNDIEVPLPGGREVHEVFQRLPLRDIDPNIMQEIRDTYSNRKLDENTYDGILEILNRRRDIPIISEPQPSLRDLSYDTYMKQVYGIPVQLPQFLIINGLTVRFIPFEEIFNIQIASFDLNPILQPWAGPPNSPNRIITLFGKNGITYLVKAKYDPAINKIFAPI